MIWDVGYFAVGFLFGRQVSRWAREDGSDAGSSVILGVVAMVFWPIYVVGVSLKKLWGLK